MRLNSVSRVHMALWQDGTFSVLRGRPRSPSVILISHETVIRRPGQAMGAGAGWSWDLT